jgi:hypothetical protein
MSLFSAREWFRSPADADEEYDVGSLAVGNFDNRDGGDGAFPPPPRAGHLSFFSQPPLPSPLRPP